MKEMRCLHCYSNEFSERNGHLYCVYCGSKYRQRPEDQEILLSMAYRELRFMNFLDAENAFEDIISRHPDLPEAYWGCVCARYGIKFEQDYTGKQIPTCCLPAIESILEDRYYQKALELSDEETAAWYSKQGEYLERVRKTWIERARKLAPYDVFISYKDSDQEKGLDRTEDSLKAQSIYTHLVTQGYSVFYSRESLSNVIGEKYEPYIFQALSTSRAMIVYGSTPEYINSTWVRNEWQRYAKKMQKGEKDKGSLIVICDGFSPKDLPPMLRSMQVLDGRDMFCYSKLDEHLKGLLAKKVSPEEEAKKKAEEEARKRAEAKAEAKRRAVAEAKKKADAEAKRRAEAEAKKKAEEKAKKDAADAAELSSEKKEGGSASKEGHGSDDKPLAVIFPLASLVIFLLIIVVSIFVSNLKKSSEISTQLESEILEFKESDNNTKIDEGLQYTSNGDGTCSVSGIGTCKDTKVVIPEESPEGDKVTSIGASAFNGCSSLTSIAISDSVMSIGHHAFNRCSNLTSITIPDSVTSIGDSAFYDCSGLTSITIPDSVTSIGDSAFYDCSGLTSITIPDSITSIGVGAFNRCSNLRSITIPDSVTSIGVGAFNRCSNLRSITIPDSVTSIGDSAFYDCSGLTSITISDSVTSIGDSAFNGCRGLTSITIPTSVTSIGDLAFYGCSSLTSITIPDGVTSIGDSAFCGCSSLTNITIPDSVTSIGDSAFYGCSSLTSITIPDSVTIIGKDAFKDCSSLTNITIFDSIASIGDGAFYGCHSLTRVTFHGTKVEWKAIEKGADWDFNTRVFIVHCTDGDIPKSES